MIIGNWLKKSTSQLSEVDSPRLDCLIMLEEVLGKDRSSILANDDYVLQDHELKQLILMIEKRTQRIPLAYIVGTRQFYGIDFFVDESVLVPRPETEVLAEKAIAIAPKNSQVLELGTGSGAIAVALKDNRDDLKITATDVSPLALVVAERNAAINHVSIEFMESDLFQNVSSKYDLILANLPYVPLPARRQPEITHEPDLALYGGNDGLIFYIQFFEEVNAYMKPETIILVEFSPTQFAAIRKIVDKQKLKIEPISEYVYLCTGM